MKHGGGWLELDIWEADRHAGYLGWKPVFVFLAMERDTDWYHPFIAYTLPDRLGLSFSTIGQSLEF